MVTRVRYIFPQTTDFREQRPAICWEHMYGWLDGYGVLFDPTLYAATGVIPEWENGWNGTTQPGDFLITTCRQASDLIPAGTAPGLYIRPRDAAGVLAADLLPEKNLLETPAGHFFYPRGIVEPLRYDRYRDGAAGWRLGEFPAVQASSGRVSVAFELFALLAAWNGDWPERRLIVVAEIIRHLLAEAGVRAAQTISEPTPDVATLRLDFQAYGLQRLFLQWFLELRGAARHEVQAADAHYLRAVHAWLQQDAAAARAGLQQAFQALATLRAAHSRVAMHFCECPHMGILLDRAGWFELEWPEHSRRYIETYLDFIAQQDYRVSLEAGAGCWRNLHARFPILTKRLGELWAAGKVDLLNGTETLPFALLSPLLMQYWQFRVGQETFRNVFGRVPEVYAAQECSLTPQLPELLAHFGYRGAMHVAQNRGRAPAEERSDIRWQSPAGSGVPAIAVRNPALAGKGCNYFLDLPLVHHTYGAAGGSIEYLNLMDLGFVPFRVQMIRAHQYAPIWGTFELARERIAAIASPDAPPRTYMADDYHISASIFYGDETNVNAFSQYETIFTRSTLYRQTQFLAWVAGRWAELRPSLEAQLPELCLQEAHDAMICQGQRRGEFHAPNPNDPPPYTRETLTDELAGRRTLLTHALHELQRRLIPAAGSPLLFNACGVDLPYARVAHADRYTGAALPTWCGEALAAGPFPAWQTSTATPVAPDWTPATLPATCGAWKVSLSNHGELVVEQAGPRATCLPTDSRFGNYAPLRTEARQTGPFLAIDAIYMNRTAGAGTVEVALLLHAQATQISVRVRYAPGRDFDVGNRWADKLSLAWHVGAPVARLYRFNPNVESETREDRVASPNYLAAVTTTGTRVTFLNEGAFSYEADRAGGLVHWLFHVADEKVWTRQMAFAFDLPNPLELGRGWSTGVVPAAAPLRAWPLTGADWNQVSAETFTDDDTLLISNLRQEPVTLHAAGGCAVQPLRPGATSAATACGGVLGPYELGLVTGFQGGERKNG